MAQAIAARFGLPADALVQRIAQGRFRVKSNVDLDTAERFAGELEKLGAVVSVVDAASGAPIARGARKPEPAPESPSGEYNTGLAAAFSGEAQQDIGLLGHADSGSFALATIDGDEDPRAGAPDVASAGPVATHEDMFRPPDEGAPIDVAIDVAAPPPPAAGEPLIDLLGDDPEGQLAGTSRQVPIGGGAVAADDDEGSAIERARRALARSPGKRVAAGAMVAVLAGFVPALVVGALRNGAYDTPRSKVAQAHETYVTTPVATQADLAVADAAVDKERADQRAIMDDTRSSIALTAGVAWLLVSGGVGFFWFRKIDWDRWA